MKLYLQFINGHPGISGKPAQHRYQKLQATRPVAHQGHHADQIEDPHKDRSHLKLIFDNKIIIFSGKNI